MDKEEALIMSLHRRLLTSLELIVHYQKSGEWLIQQLRELVLSYLDGIAYFRIYDSNFNKKKEKYEAFQKQPFWLLGTRIRYLFDYGDWVYGEKSVSMPPYKESVFHHESYDDTRIFSNPDAIFLFKNKEAWIRNGSPEFPPYHIKGYPLLDKWCRFHKRYEDLKIINSMDHIKETIESYMEQDFSDFENKLEKDPCLEEMLIQSISIKNKCWINGIPLEVFINQEREKLGLDRKKYEIGV